MKTPSLRFASPGDGLRIVTRRSTRVRPPRSGARTGEVASARRRLALDDREGRRGLVALGSLDAATAGDLAPFTRLLEVVTRPFEERPALKAYAGPAPAGDSPYRTFCGT